MVIFSPCPIVGVPLCGGPCSTEHAGHAQVRLCMHTGMVFIRQEVALWFQAEWRSAGMWHTVADRPSFRLTETKSFLYVQDRQRATETHRHHLH